MGKEKIAYRLFLLTFLFFLPLSFSQAQAESLWQRPVISVVGRLALEEHGKEEWLVLHAKDAKTYLIKGNLTEKLKNSLLELGENNLVSLAGDQDGKSNISSGRFYKYEYDEEGERKLNVDTKAIRYYHLRVTQILFARKSYDVIPPPQRDIKEEKRLMTTGGGSQAGEPVIMGEIYGKIVSVDLKSPLKTIEVLNRDKSSPLKKIILMLTAGTHIVKQIDQEEPIRLTSASLRRGQRVIAVYSRQGIRSEALFITITKD